MFDKFRLKIKQVRQLVKEGATMSEAMALVFKK